MFFYDEIFIFIRFSSFSFRSLFEFIKVFMTFYDSHLILDKFSFSPPSSVQNYKKKFISKNLFPEQS